MGDTNMSDKEMVIDVWADVVCPWCYIGKRRLEKAIQNFAHKEQLVIRHRAFQLQPDAQGITPTSQYLSEKYRISPEQVSQMQANVCAVADGEGLCYNLEGTLTGNTFNAHRLLLWAKAQGNQDELLEKLFKNYFELNKPVFDNADLIQAAAEVGLNVSEVGAFLDSDELSDKVLEDRSIASQLGANGVPFFVFDMKYGISGAQPQEVFNQTLEKAWEERENA
jgi:predicted DsbA family dithiol-disulfide isomerase